MYRDAVQWSKIRHRILVKGDSRRQVARETGISTNTIDKMLAHRHPQPYGPRSHRYPRLGPTRGLDPPDAPEERQVNRQ